MQCTILTSGGEFIHCFLGRGLSLTALVFVYCWNRRSSFSLIKTEYFAPEVSLAASTLLF